MQQTQMKGETEMRTKNKKNRPDPHLVSIVKCTNCQKRWTAVRPENVRIYELECPQCGKIGYAKETGERVR